MANKKQIMGMLFFILGVLATSCNVNAPDRALNGTWITDGFEINFNNGRFEESIGGTQWRRGTYTTSQRDIFGEITVIPTHIFGGGFNLLFGLSEHESGIESKWVSINDFTGVFKSALIKMGMSESEAQEETNDFVNLMNSANRTSTYNISGSSLYLTNEGVTQNFERK